MALFTIIKYIDNNAPPSHFSFPAERYLTIKVCISHHLYLIHFARSLILGFLPCMKIPTRYILAATHTIPRNDRKSTTAETIISHSGIPEGIRDIMTIGDVNGTIDSQKASDVLGSAAAIVETIRPINTGITTINDN